jgi:DmsE family decaheme c-type cytochrome
MESKMTLWKSIFLLCIFLLAALYGCETLKSSKALIPIKEYERMLVGRIDANYIGTDRCLSACHSHDRIRRDFEASTMGVQMSGQSNMPQVNCESCHGPGSLAVENVTPELVAKDAAEAKETACKYDTFIDLKNLPSQAKSLLCLRCHSENATLNLHNWNAGAHALSDVSCFDCHNVHAGPSLITQPKDTRDMCLKCHQQQAAEFSLPSRHPLMEKKIFCTDCHDPHGTAGEGLLKEDTLKETCTRCHGEKEGPYAFEHADINDDCAACHSPHGSVNNNLLIVREPFLCLQCHQGHTTTDDASTRVSKGAYYTRCTDCHSQIHGSDLPSASGKGMFIN